MSVNRHAANLRSLAEELRRKPIPLAECIPAMQRAADEIDRLEAQLRAVADKPQQAAQES